LIELSKGDFAVMAVLKPVQRLFAFGIHWGAKRWLYSSAVPLLAIFDP